MPDELRPPTDICLTVDVEFSIGGAFDDPARHRPIAEPVVECRVNGHGHGLDFLLDTLAAHGQRATFFVETLNAHYFGDAPMRRYAHRIARAGHEVGLHVHPCWRTFRTDDWAKRLTVEGPPSDDLRGCSDAEMTDVLRDALRIMDRWDLPRPTSIRMGNLMCDHALYKVLARLGFRAASNIGVAIEPGADKSLHLTGGAHVIDGVTELPVMTYTASLPLGLSRTKGLTITGTGADTTQRLLQQAHAAQAGPVVVLTHPFEFVKTRDFTYSDLRPNRINQHRLDFLCALVARAPDSYRMTTVTDAADRSAETATLGRRGRRLSSGSLSVLSGLAANRLNDLVWRL